MTNQTQFTQAEKEELLARASVHIDHIGQVALARITEAKEKQDEGYKLFPGLKEVNLSEVAAITAETEAILARIVFYQEEIDKLRSVQGAPYFIRLEVKWLDTGERAILYIGKFEMQTEQIYSWISPISTLRYSEIGESSYKKPLGEERRAEILRKDTFLIVNGQIVFMTVNDTKHPRQVIYQKHLEQQKEFLLPEIVAELDKLQDQIIRSDPFGPLLISGPAGSGKTTLALHRVAYLVLTPEFKEFFEPERIIVFVADDKAVKYFSNLLPELGINGVRVTTFTEWGTMITNSRFKASRSTLRFRPTNLNEAVDFIEKHNPYPEVHPRLVYDIYRKVKQDTVKGLKVEEGFRSVIYPALDELYQKAAKKLDQKLRSGFLEYWKFQQANKWLDEVDLVTALSSLVHPVKPWAHIVVDEVQNWFPAQIKLVKAMVSTQSNSITYIGDIRQKAKAFTINSWEEIHEDFTTGPDHRVELLKVYRNTQQLLKYLKSKGYDVTTKGNNKVGEDVTELNWDKGQIRQQIKKLIEKIRKEHGDVTIGVLAKYRSTLIGLEHLSFDSPNTFILSIEEAQGVEFHTVILLQAKDLKEGALPKPEAIGATRREEFKKQNKHLFYVAATRAKEMLYVVN